MRGGILAVTSDGERILTGGDDGKVVATNAKGESETLATDAKHRWIDRVALGPDGAVAWSAGKQAFVRNAKGEVKSVEMPSTVGGLAFSPKGLRLAVAHYGGVSLWFPNAQAAPETFAWKGSHLDVMFSPDGRFLVTAMQEPTLHGWRLADAKDMRMSGYSAKVRSMRLDAGRQVARDVRLGATDHVAVPDQGRPDGQAAAHARALREARGRGRVPSEAGDRRGRLRGRADHDLRASRTARRFWRGGRAADRSRRWRGARMEQSSRSERKTARRGSRTSRNASCDHFLGAGARGAGAGGGGGSIALSGRRFHVWLLPNSA